MDININYNPTVITELCKIMKKNNSDKSCGKHNYTTFYYEIFKNVKDKNLQIFELGLGTNNTNLLSNMGPNGTPGASLRGWRDFFQYSDIYGADIDKNILFEETKIKTFYCDQLKKDDIQNLWENNNLPDKFDIIIEDGLHTFDAQVNFFENSIHKIKNDGVYITEDIHLCDINRFKNKILEWNNNYPILEFRLEVIPNTINQLDNIVMCVQYKKYDHN